MPATSASQEQDWEATSRNVPSYSRIYNLQSPTLNAGPIKCKYGGQASPFPY